MPISAITSGGKSMPTLRPAISIWLIFYPSELAGRLVPFAFPRIFLRLLVVFVLPPIEPVFANWIAHHDTSRSHQLGDEIGDVEVLVGSDEAKYLGLQQVDSGVYEEV